MKKEKKSKELEFLEELLKWEKDMYQLRQKYMDTPAGFPDESSGKEAERYLAQLEEQYEEKRISRVISGSSPPIEKGSVVRWKLLRKIGSFFDTGHRPVILHGMGGIGKSTLAAQYASVYGDRYETVLWMNCGNGFSSACADDSSWRISNLRYDAARFRSVKRYAEKKIQGLSEIAGRESLLLILDACDFLSDPLMSLLFSVPADILVTTRVSPLSWTDAMADSYAALPVPETGFEAEEEWNAFAGDTPERERLTEFRDVFGGNLLAVGLALRNGTTLSLRSYLRRTRLKKEERRILLTMAAAPSGEMPQTLLLALSGSNEYFVQTLGLRGLIQVPGQDTALIRMHPLIREAVRQQFQLSLSSFAFAVRNMADLLFNAWERDDENNRKMEPYVREILRLFPHPLYWLAADLDVLVTFLWIQGYYEEALAYSRKLFSVCLRHYGDHHDLTGYMALRSGAVCRNAGKLEESDKWFLRAWESLQNADSSDTDEPHRMLYRIEANTRMCIRAVELGEKEQALAYNQRATELAEELRKHYSEGIPGYRGDPCLEYPYKLMERGEVFLAFGDIRQASVFADAGFQELGRLHTAEYRQNEFLFLKIRILLAQGEHGKALPLARRTLENALRYRGTHSREPLRAMELIGDALFPEDPAEAARYYKQVLETLILQYPDQLRVRDRLTEKWNRAMNC